jgi:hypothetical protein
MVTITDQGVTLKKRAEIGIRGSSSSQFPKKPYRLELQDDNGDDLKIPLLGMPKESDWILFAGYTDKTLIRDVVAYELWRRMGYYAPRTRYVELYLNRASANVQRSTMSNVQPSTNDYEGVYVLMEKIKRGKDRLNVAKLTRGDNSEPKITGGYIFKRDRTNNPNDRVFHSSRKLEFVWDEPKGRDVTPQQEEYLTNYINEFETVLYSENFGDPENGYRKYIDVDSFVDYHWMQEVGKNPDGYWTSEFYHKDRGGKLKMGPIWDCDLFFGNAKYNDCYKTNEWRWKRSGGSNYRWFRRLFKDPDFLQRYIDRWSELRTNVLATSNVLALVDRFAGELSQAQKRNYERWPTLGKHIHPVKQYFDTYEEEVDWLKQWIRDRLDWIDSQDFPKPAMVVDEPQRHGGTEGQSRNQVLNQLNELNGAEVLAQPAQTFIHSSTNSPSTIRMACLVGKIHYTTDGSDPRVSGGGVSPKAAEYKEPIAVTPWLRLCARVRSEYGLWSAPVVYGEGATEGNEGNEVAD